ncbi:MAG: hypothetical protein JOZ58_01800, partial [Acetobacteraceae bacterium]|nr:hypothetical protein [Acetobacteraceae bacterium]
PARLFWVRWFVLLVSVGATLLAHTMIETPNMQYVMWARNHSLEPSQPDTHNLLGIQSSSLGAVAATVALILNLLLVTGLISMLWDGLAVRRDNPVTG